MNTIIFVLMVYTHGPNWAPSIEFKDELKCQKAAQIMKTTVDANKNWGNTDMRLPICVRIEK